MEEYVERRTHFRCRVSGYMQSSELSRNLLWLAAVLSMGLGSSAMAQTNATIIGTIEVMQIDNPANPYSGGRIVVGGQTIIIPRNLVLEMPANFLPMGEFFAQAPADCVVKGKSGVAAADVCEGAAAGVATILANRTAAGDLIAGDVFIEKGQETVSGVVSFINYDEGYFRVNGVNNTDTSGLMVRINDPEMRHTIQQGKGCRPGNIVNCSADVRFTNDPDNYTFTYTTGYPACIPSTVIDGINRVTAADATGLGDPFCPQTNRDAINPVPDSTHWAPLRIGDPITADGNFETIDRVLFLSAHTVSVGIGLRTSQTDPTQPDYVIFDEVFIDAAGFDNARVRGLFIGFGTKAADILTGLPGVQVDIFGLHVDPATHVNHEVPLASTVGNPLTVNQGIGVGAPGIFRIRYDVDFPLGAPVLPTRSPCTNLRNAGFNVCSIFQTMEEEFSVLIPNTKEVIARTRTKLASPNLQVFDIQGRSTRWGEYLSPIAAEFPNFLEINLALVARPFIIAGLPWNLDRRVHPAGCVTGICESTPQPLDPFPYSRLDPRIQAGIPGVPVGVRDRIISEWGLDPVSGIPGSGNVLLPWPPTDPPPLANTLAQLKVEVTRATHKVGPNFTSVDVWASAAPTHSLELSGIGLITMPMDSDGAGRFFAHAEFPSTTPVPATITVTDLTDGFIKTHVLQDEVVVATATYLNGTPTLSIFANSSGTPVVPLTLCTGETFTSAGNLDLLVGLVPPESVCVLSPTLGTRTNLAVTVSGCDDNNLCTTDTIDPVLGCINTPVVCDDGLACTVDSCNAALGCLATPDDAFCADGLFCNGVETCNALLGCVAGVPVDCVDTITCTADSCNEALDQCDHVPDNLLCPDAVACTTDTCDPIVGCMHQPDNVACSNGIFCDGAEICDAIAGCGPGTVPCNDVVACTTDSCDEVLDTCTNTPVNAVCDNGVMCDGIETCDPVNGCVPGTPIAGCCLSNVDCDNLNACDGVETCNLVTQQCVAGTPVVCGDGLFCNGTETCVGGICTTPVAPCLDPCEQCNEVAGVCDWCVLDVNLNGSIDGGDFAFFSGCFGSCYPAGDPCSGANFDLDPNNCVGGGDFAAITGCFGLVCGSCPNCFPAAPPLLSQGFATGASSASAVLQLVALDKPSKGDTTNMLPSSTRNFELGHDVYVEVWAQATNRAEGLSSAYVDLSFDATKLATQKVIVSETMGLFHRHSTGKNLGKVIAVGGCASLGSTQLGDPSSWVRIGSVKMRTSDLGVTMVRVGPSLRPLGVSIAGQPGDVDSANLLFGSVEIEVMGTARISRKSTTHIRTR